METNLDVDLIRVFVKVVQFGSFSRAADSLRVPKSTISKGVARLEVETKTQLLVRTTRSLTLTAAGRSFYESCLGPIQSIEEAKRALYGSDSILTGTVRMTAPEDLGSFVIAPAIGELTRKHPDLNFDLHYTDEVVDLVRDGFDFAVRVGRLRESRLHAKRLGEIVLIMVAAPSYLKANDRIRSPKDLKDHGCLSISVQGLSAKWTLRSSKETITLGLVPRIMSNQMTSLRQMALAGGGIALVPRYLCRDDLESKKLVQVLPEWVSPGIPVSIISPLRSTTSARLKLVSDHVGTAIREALNN